MKLLVIVDMQKDFITGSLGTKEAQAIVPKVLEKIEKYIEEDWGIVFTQDTHYDDYLETQEGKKLPVVHCIDETEGWKICDELIGLYEDDCSYIKDTFGSVDLAEDIYCNGDITEVELIGLCTDICVISNALMIKSFRPELPITVDASCCAGVTPESHKNALAAMKMCQINIINEEEK